MPHLEVLRAICSWNLDPPPSTPPESSATRYSFYSTIARATRYRMQIRASSVGGIADFIQISLASISMVRRIVVSSALFTRHQYFKPILGLQGEFNFVLFDRIPQLSWN